MFRNSKLSIIDGFNNLKSIVGDVGISQNPLLISIMGFTKLRTVEHASQIGRNNSLNKVIGFSSHEYVGGIFSIEWNLSLLVRLWRNPQPSIQLSRQQDAFL